MKASLERFARYWPGLPLLTNTGALVDSGSEAAVWDGCVEHYRALAEHAHELGMRIALEALAPSLMNRNSILCTLGQADELARAVDHPAFGLCLDIYNSWQDPALAETVAALGERLFLVQLADWRRPRSYHDRLALGDGRIPLAPLLQRLAASGYQGAYVLEIFSADVPDSLWRDAATLEAAIERSQAFFAAHQAG